MALVYMQLHFIAVGMVSLFRVEGCWITSLPHFICAFFLPLSFLKSSLRAKVYTHPSGWVDT